jgi:phosphoribosylformimino-5-aminoimidazole carboxamide ribotide isomerase
VSTVLATDLAKQFEDAGADAIIYTDIDRDGMLGGVNLEATLAMARAVRLPVIASGGVASLNDLASLAAVASEGIEGVIIGRALYDGRIDPTAALALVAAR